MLRLLLPYRDSNVDMIDHPSYTLVYLLIDIACLQITPPALLPSDACFTNPGSLTYLVFSLK